MSGTSSSTSSSTSGRGMRSHSRALRASSSSSLKTTTSPWPSMPRASTTFSDSLSTTSWPRFRGSSSSSGWIDTRIAQCGRESLVLRHGLGELALGLEDPLLEGADALRCVLQPAPEQDHLFLQALHLVLEVAHLALVLGEASLVLCRHDASSFRRRRSTAPCAHHTQRPGGASGFSSGTRCKLSIRPSTP